MMIQKEKQRMKNEVISGNELQFLAHRPEKVLRCLVQQILAGGDLHGGGGMVEDTRKESVFSPFLFLCNFY